MPAPKYRKNPFKTWNAYGRLYDLAAQQSRPSPELGAIRTAIEAILFILTPPPSHRNEEGRLLVGIEEILIGLERGHVYLAAISPWVEEVKRRATDEQRQLLHELGLDGRQGEDKDTTEQEQVAKEEDEAQEGIALEAPNTTLNPKILPEPAHAVTLLEALVQRYDPQSTNHTCTELAIQTLRFLIDTHQVEDFCAELDKSCQLHTPTGEPPSPAIGESNISIA